MHRLTTLFLALALVMSVGGLTAGMIDFNDATSGANYGPVVSSDGVTVSFFVGSNALVCPCGGLSSAVGAEPDSADATTTAFQNPVDGGDTIAGGGGSGFLTDEAAGPVAALDYFFLFSVGIPDLSLEVLDYRGDGGVVPPATVTLETYSSADWNPANLQGSAPFLLAAQGPDGLVISLNDVGGGLPIRSARVTFSQTDIGTGIDNLSWTDVSQIPEPGTVILFGTGLLALGAIVRKRHVKA